jgi:ubiquinone/menaquinone biosynthesis C-methylase UbiE
MIRTILLVATATVLLSSSSTAFHVESSRSSSKRLSAFALRNDKHGDNLQSVKDKLLGIVQPTTRVDDVFADPVTKRPLTVTASVQTVFGDAPAVQSFTLKSDTATYEGSSDLYVNLLEPVNDDSTNTENTSKQQYKRQLYTALLPFVPPPLRSAMSSDNADTNTYIPMRDLFTSPAVSFAYERGWRQGFAQAGFPGADAEAKLALDYFAAVPRKQVLVDMSCATGLFTRRFASGGKQPFARVLGCDYSDSMLREARRRLNEQNIRNVELVRLDVGQIPMRNGSVDALHAGAAMHCWPDLPAAAKEIYRVLKPNGGRYFATTFLSSYFRVLLQAEGNGGGGGNANMGPSQQAFQYFANVNELKSLMISGGFDPNKIEIEVLGAACVVIRCEK